MPAKISIEAMPGPERETFLRALAREVYRIRESPELWAKVQQATQKTEGSKHDNHD